MHPTRTGAALLALLLACAGSAAAQRPELVSVPRARRLSLPRANAAPAAQCPDYVAPPEMGSDTVLSMAPADFSVGDSSYRRNVYNGQYNAPVIRATRGQRLHFIVRNDMAVTPTEPAEKIAATNQHYHGMIVTPQPDSGDNVVPVSFGPGQSNRNSFWIPPQQSEGMMWYHPHPHGSTGTQVAGGLAGALIVGDLLASYPAYAGATERVMYVKDTRDGRNSYLNINGSPCMGLTIRPGERQLWRIGNLTGATWLNLRLGERGRGYRFIVLALDGNHLVRPTEVDSLFLAPGQRAEAIVIGGSRYYEPVAFYSDSIRSAFDKDSHELTTINPRVDLGTLTVSGTPVAYPPEALEPSRLPADRVLIDSIRKLVTDPNAEEFTVHFQFVGGKFMLNDRSYDHSRLDRAVAVGRTQEWTLINDTWFLHTFHIHQVDFVVTKINGVDQPDSVHLDNVHLGIHPIGHGKWAGDTVVVRFTFSPIAAGPFVFHCHDLVHEDRGMMANVCVYDPATGRRSCDQWFPPAGAHSHTSSTDGAAPAHAHAAASPAITPAPVHAHGGGMHRRE